MQSQNLKEYEFIRDEMLRIKECITTYIGFVIGGSGVAFLGLANISNNIEQHTLISFTSFLLSFTVTLVLSILFYKFNSYNRLAGYCKLLNQEKLVYKENAVIDEQFMSWEICMDLLRESKSDKNILLKKSKNITILGLNSKVNEIIIKVFSEKFFLTKMTLGFWLFFKTLIGKDKTKSWHFPLYVVSVFFSLNSIFLGIGFYISLYSSPSEINRAQEIIVIGVVIFQILVWSLYFMKLYEIMEGNSTIEAYCCKFLPIRYEYIKQQNKDIEYQLITLK